MSSCAVSNSVEIGSNDNYVDGDESNQRIQMQLDTTDPYFHYYEAIQVDEPLSKDTTKSYISMEFNTPEDAFTFYNNYACCLGFSVRKNTMTSNKNGLSSIRYVYSKAGKSDWHKRKERSIGCSADLAAPEKEHGITRVDCKASCRIRIMKSEKWQVSVFTEDHNHELIMSLSKIQNLRSYKRMTVSDKEVIRKLSAQNVGNIANYGIYAEEHEGKGNIRFKKEGY